MQEWEVIPSVPKFPPIRVTKYAPRVVDLDRQAKVIDAIPWDRRGIFLCASTEVLRAGELFPLNVTDYQNQELFVGKATQGQGEVARVVDGTKNDSAEWRKLWSPDLIEWIEWRLEQATAQSLLKGEVALFPNWTAKNPGKRWTHYTIYGQWKKACVAVGEQIPFQEGTRHSTITAVAEHMPQRMLQAFTRHKSFESLNRYSHPKPSPAAILKATEFKKRKQRKSKVK